MTKRYCTALALACLLAMFWAPLAAQLPVSVPGAVTIGNVSHIVDGTTFVAGSTLTIPAGCVRDDAAPSVGGSTTDGKIGPCRMGPYGNLYFSFVNPADGTFPTFATDATQGSASPATGPQLMASYRADLGATAPVSTGASLRPLTDGLGRFLDAGPCPGGNILDGQATIADGASTQVIAAGAANVVTEVWEIDLGNSSASFVTVDIRDGTGGAVLAQFALPAGGAISRALRTPIRSTAATAIAADPSAVVSTIYVSLRGCATR